MLNQDQMKFNKILATYLLNRRYSDSPEKIIDLYQELRRQIKENKVITKTILVSLKENFNYPQLKKLSSKYSTINFLREGIVGEIGRFLKTFLLHGSFGSKDFLENWSDLDVMIVFKEELFEDKKNLIIVRNALRKFSTLFYKIDPLNHHRFHLATSLDLEYYPQIILPLPCYQEGLWLAGEREFEVRVRDDFPELRQDLSGRIKHFEKRIKFPPRNALELKLDLSHLLLLPSLILQTKGIYLYKKLSFDRAKKEFPQLDFSIVDKASILRKNWRTPNLVKWYPDFLIKYLPNWLNNLKIRFLAGFSRRRKISMNDQELKEFIRKSHELYRAVSQI